MLLFPWGAARESWGCRGRRIGVLCRLVLFAILELESERAVVGGRERVISLLIVKGKGWEEAVMSWEWQWEGSLRLSCENRRSCLCRLLLVRRRRRGLLCLIRNNQQLNSDIMAIVKMNRACILFSLLIELLSIFLENTFWVAMGGDEAHVVYLGPSSLRSWEGTWALSDYLTKAGSPD